MCSISCESRYFCDPRLITENKTVAFVSASELFAGVKTVFMRAMGLCNCMAGRSFASANTLLARASNRFACANALFAYVNTLFTYVSHGRISAAGLSAVGIGFGIVFPWK